MKTKIALLFFIGIFTITTVSSQLLTNTTWKVYTTSSTFFFYFKFDGDTISFSSDNISYSNVSIYDEIGSNFDITDLMGFCTSYTGHYTFAISSDTLKFTVIEDTCDFSRETVFNTYYWIAEPVGIDELLMPTTNKIFPNPATSYCNVVTEINSEIKIYDLSGKIISTLTVQNKTTTIDVGNWNPGVYTIVTNKNTVVKLVVVR